MECTQQWAMSYHKTTAFAAACQSYSSSSAHFYVHEMLFRSSFAVGVQLVLGEGIADLTDLSGIEVSVAVVFDPLAQALVDDVCWHRGFEGGVAYEEDDGTECELG
jgi:hypothetical protein